MRSMLIIANPTSGRGRGKRTAEAVRQVLEAASCNVSIRFTGRSGDAESMARSVCADEAVQPDCIVACGGDGTVQEIAHVLAERKAEGGREIPSLGLAPAGRCNDFARVFGIPRDPDVIAETILTGHMIAVDLGCANGRHFCTVATIGIDAEISRFVDEMRIPLRGTPAYLYGALRVLMSYQPRGLRLEGDFGVIEEPVFLASTANTSSYGGAVPIAPSANPTDGWLDVCVIEFTSRWNALRLIPSVLRGTHPVRRGVRLERTRQVQVDAPSPVEIWADGEHVANTPARIEIVPQAIRVISRVATV